jgi:hypothetical protein
MEGIVMVSKTKEIKLRVSQEELEIIRECLDKKSRDLSDELSDLADGESTSAIIEVSEKLLAARAARCKIDIVS